MLDEPRVVPAPYREVESTSSPLAGGDDLDRLLERIGDARFVLLGEASHGTSDYYDWRAVLSVAVGFGSYRGHVIAGRRWEAPLERMRVPPARPGSWEHVLHTVAGGGARLLTPEAC